MITTIKVSSDKTTICVLKTDCIIDLHNLLSTNYVLLKDMEPVQPAGIKSMELLNSAVDRQTTGSGEWYKYDNHYNNCATLVYGLVKNHPFHNGNKRTALLSMIKHLYANGYVLKPSLKEDELFKFFVNIAANELPYFSKKYYNDYNKKQKQTITRQVDWDTDEVIAFMAYWLKNNVVPKQNTLKGSVKISHLKKILLSKGIHLEANGTKLTIYREKKEYSLFRLFSKLVTYDTRTYSIGNSLTEVPAKVILDIRKDYHLTISDGVDNSMFYDDESFLEQEIIAYKKIIYRLSTT